MLTPSIHSSSGMLLVSSSLRALSEGCTLELRPRNAQSLEHGKGASSQEVHEGTPTGADVIHLLRDSQLFDGSHGVPSSRNLESLGPRHAQEQLPCAHGELLQFEDSRRAIQEDDLSRRYLIKIMNNGIQTDIMDGVVCRQLLDR